MFSQAQKQKIAEEIEKLLLSFNHPEMPKTCPNFFIHIDGVQSWSFAEIKPNWHFDSTPPSINAFNERDLSKG